MKLLQKIIAILKPNSVKNEFNFDNKFLTYYQKCKPYTMTSIERLYSLYQSVNYVLKNNIEGDFVECGVWKGGSSLLIALILKEHHITNRRIFLYDTFEGMSEPTENDISKDGETAKSLLEKNKNNKEAIIWCYSSLDEVKKNISISQLNENQLIFVKGKVEDTIPNTIPKSISLLRLDTDWYESTKHEIENLFPILSSKGILIIDDYGHWEGSKKAIDEYFENQEYTPLLNRIDYTGRLAIKL